MIRSGNTNSPYLDYIRNTMQKTRGARLDFNMNTQERAQAG